MTASRPVYFIVEVQATYFAILYALLFRMSYEELEGRGGIESECVLCQGRIIVAFNSIRNRKKAWL